MRSGATPGAAQARALQGAVGNRALSRLVDATLGAAQRKKNPERERLERIRMWSELLQQKEGLAPADARTLAEAFANTGTSIVTLEEFAPLLGLGWTAGPLVTLIRKYLGDDGGRTQEDWCVFAVRRADDPDAVADSVRAGQVDWVNAPATFHTGNDRYTATEMTPTGDFDVFVLEVDHAEVEERTLDGSQTVYLIESDEVEFVATGELRDLLLSDSLYNVTATGYTRYAPVNMVERPAEVNFAATRHFTYMTPGSEAEDAVMHSDDADMRVVRLEGDSVIFDIGGDEFALSRTPAAGDLPFDFDYDSATGTIAHGHPGHALYF
ncbi:MAG: hypothetical protein AB7F65_00275 [Dehalococcoidia bacterium]